MTEREAIIVGQRQEIARLTEDGGVMRPLDSMHALTDDELQLQRVDMGIHTGFVAITVWDEVFRRLRVLRADLARAVEELAGSRNEAKALSESLDGMQQALTQMQKDLDAALTDLEAIDAAQFFLDHHQAIVLPRTWAELKRMIADAYLVRDAIKRHR